MIRESRILWRQCPQCGLGPDVAVSAAHTRPVTRALDSRPPARSEALAWQAVEGQVLPVTAGRCSVCVLPFTPGRGGEGAHPGATGSSRLARVALQGEEGLGSHSGLGLSVPARDLETWVQVPGTSHAFSEQNGTREA